MIANMKRAGYAALILGGAAAASWGHAAEWTWRHLPQFTLDQVMAPVYLDLDGDGENEVILRGAANSGLTGVLKKSGDGLALVDIHVEEFPNGHFVSVPAGGGEPARLIVPSWDWVNQSGQLTELTGIPLRRSRVLALDFPVRPWIHGDVDGDGEPEIVEFDPGASPPLVRAIDYATGALRWTYEMPATPNGSLAALQLDEDPALEIIVVGSQPGLILDGASGSVEWSYAPGFGFEFHAGRFGEDPDVPTFATRGASVRVFRGQPYALLNEFTVSNQPGPHGAGAVHDVDGDGGDELVMAPYFWTTSFRAFDMRNGQIVSTWPSAFPNSTRAGFGRLEPASEVLLTHGSTPPIGSVPLGVRSQTVPAGAVQYDSGVTAGPFNAIAAADVDGDGQQDIVTLIKNVASNPSAAPATVMVFSNGAAEPSASREMPAGTALLTVADLDGAPGQEIVVANPDKVMVLDGLTLETRWERRFEAQTDLDGFNPVALSSADFDGDGIADVAMLVDNFTFANRVVALSGLDGQTLWISPAMPGFMHERSLMIAQLDNDPAMEVVVNSQMTMHVFDAITKQQQWFMQPNGWSLKSASLVGQYPNCSLGLLDNWSQLRLYDCQSRDLIGAVPLPWFVDVVRQVDESGNLLVYSHSGRLYGLKRAGGGYFRYPITASVGASLPLATERMIVAGSSVGDTLDLLIGTRGFPGVIRLDPSDGLWRGDFEH